MEITNPKTKNKDLEYFKEKYLKYKKKYFELIESNIIRHLTKIYNTDNKFFITKHGDIGYIKNKNKKYEDEDKDNKKVLFFKLCTIVNTTSIIVVHNYGEDNYGAIKSGDYNIYILGHCIVTINKHYTPKNMLEFLYTIKFNLTHNFNNKINSDVVTFYTILNNDAIIYLNEVFTKNKPTHKLFNILLKYANLYNGYSDNWKYRMEVYSDKFINIYASIYDKKELGKNITDNFISKYGNCIGCCFLTAWNEERIFTFKNDDNDILLTLETL